MEVGEFHSITSSARESSIGEISGPSALAVLGLMRNSNFVGCSTGSSAGVSHLRIAAPPFDDLVIGAVDAGSSKHWKGRCGLQPSDGFRLRVERHGDRVRLIDRPYHPG